MLFKFGNLNISWSTLFCSNVISHELLLNVRDSLKVRDPLIHKKKTDFLRWNLAMNLINIYISNLVALHHTVWLSLQQRDKKKKTLTNYYYTKTSFNVIVSLWGDMGNFFLTKYEFFLSINNTWVSQKFCNILVTWGIIHQPRMLLSRSWR